MQLEAHRESLPQLFEDLAEQFFRNIIPPEEIGSGLREKLTAEGESLEALLRDWMRVLAGALSAQRMVFKAFKVTLLHVQEGRPYSLHAEAIGELWDPQRHSLRRAVERLAPQEVILERNDTGYHAKLAFRG